MKWMGKVGALVLAAVMLAQPVAASALTYGSWYSPYRYSNYPYSNYSTYTAPRTTATTGSTTTTAKAPSTTPSTSATASVEQALLTLLNQDRLKYGLTALKGDSTLTSLARMKSSDMVAKNYFSHTSPTYGTPAQMLSRYSVSYKAFGENIAQGADAARIHSMWMASPGHRANILNPKFTHVGIGVVSGRTSLTATQLFITR